MNFSLNFSLEGEKHKETCKYFLANSINNFQTAVSSNSLVAYSGILPKVVLIVAIIVFLSFF